MLREAFAQSEWRYLRWVGDENGQVVDFRLTVRRDAKAANAFFNKAIIGDVSAPDLIGSVDHHIPQQIGPDLMLWVLLARGGLLVDRNQSA